MKKSIWGVVIVALISSCAGPRSSLMPGKVISKFGLDEKIEQIIKVNDPNINIGVQIRSLKDGKILFERNAHRHFVPASTIKIITLAGALYYLGPSFRFATDIYAQGLNKEGSKAQNIFIKGSGDPSLMDHDLVNLALELKQMGISHVAGNVYVDAGVFDNEFWSSGSAIEDRSYGFGAPVSGLNLNYNRLLIKTMPAQNGHSLAYAIVRPLTKYVKVKSTARTTGKGGQRVNVSIVHKDGKKDTWPSSASEGLQHGDTVVIDGYVQKGSEAHFTKLAVKDPSMLVGTFFKEQLKKIGIKVDGQVMPKALSEDAIKLATHHSRSLGEALIDFTKISNNVANDSLLKAISAQKGERPATASGGLELIGSFLEKEIGIKKGSLIAVDGSGLSRYNLITPDQMVKVLNFAALHFNMGPEFMASLPIGGYDGTLGSRFKSDLLRGNIRAKTGTLSGLSNLAGYISADNGERYSFAVMINGFLGSGEKYRKMQEELISSLFKEAKTQLATSK